jgi:ABC-type Fe3+/spermidine/putrescine transport system ATPase subunit
MASPAIAIESLSKSFPGEDVLHDIEFDVGEGEFCVVIGPSGCGKSTLLKCIAGLFDHEGDVYLNGTNSSDVSIPERDIGFVFQEFEETLFPHMTVEENIAFGLRQKDVSEDEIEREVDDMLELLSIEGTKNDYPDQISGGQQQRVELARQLIRETDLLLLDDPLADLDYKLQKKMELEMHRLHDSMGSTFVYVTHNQDQALKLADRIVVMNHGHIEQIGTPEEVYHEPETGFVGRFIGDSNMLVPESVSDDGGTLTVETEIGSVTAVANGNASDVSGGATDSMVFLRPESIAIGSDAESCVNNHTGTLEGRTYTGEFTEFAVSFDGLDTEFQILDPGNRRIGSIGEPVTIGWDTADAHYIQTVSVTDTTTLSDLQEL